MAEKPVCRVFVSSTERDLMDHRRAARDAINDLEHLPWGMENFGSRSGKTPAACFEDIARADALLVIVAHRYGWVPSVEEGGDGKTSMTELEVNKARELGKEVFPFFVRDDYGWPGPREQDGLLAAEGDSEAVEVFRRVRALKAFRKKLGDQPCGFFTTAETLRSAILASKLRDLTKKPSRPPPAPPQQNPLPAYLEQLVTTIEQEPLALDDLCFDTRTLDAVYVEVHADSEDSALMLRGDERGDWKCGQPIDRFLSLEEKRCFALLGEPGSGKSTLVAKVAADRGRAALDKLKKKEELDKAGIPVRVRLSELGSAAALDVIAFAAAGSEVGLDKALRDAAARGELLFLLDGLDEVKPDERAGVMKKIAALSAKTAWLDAGCRVIVTSRPFGYKPPATVFMLLALVPLDADKQRALLTAWLKGREGGAAHVDAILKAVGAERSLRELAGNPLMLTLMALLALDDLREHKGVRLPKGRAGLLKRAIHRLVAEDGRRAVAHRDEVIEVLEDAALHLLRQGAGPYDRVHTKAALAHSACFERLCKMESAWQDPDLVLKEAAGKTGLLVMVGRERCRFVHRALQERLAASALGRRGRAEWEPLVAKLGDDPETLGAWAETFALLADELGDANALLRDLAQANPDLAVRALSSAPEGSVTPETLLLLVKMEGGRKKWEERGKVIDGLLERFGKTAIAVGILRQLRPTVRHGADLFFVRDALLSIAEGGDEQAKRSARDELGRLFDHLDRPPVLTEVELPSGKRASYWCDVPYPAGPFALARVLVTNKLYELFDPGHSAERWGLGGNDRGPKFDQHPVVNVTWFEAVVFCLWLAQTNPGVVLPTETQWEFAATKGDGRKYPWGKEDPDGTRAVFDQDLMKGHTAPVGSFPLGAGPFGHLDLAGNVWEWMVGRHDKSVDTAGNCVDKSVDTIAVRVLRGGPWSDEPRSLASACRGGSRPSDRNQDYGFRCARLLYPPSTD